MDIIWFRDLVICVWGLVATIVVVMLGVLALLLYMKLRPILNSIEATSNTISAITATVKDEVVTPVVQLAALIRGISQGINLISNVFKKGKEVQDG